MKRIISVCLAAFLIFLAGCGQQAPLDSAHSDSAGSHDHCDADDNGVCDTCQKSVLEYFDIYAINDLHGKIADTSLQPGVDELSTYLKGASIINDNVIILSSGDMWQGSSESNLTKGILTTEWMNDLGIVSMTLGNHEYDWGEEFIRQNQAVAQFPFLGINIYSRETDSRVDYCAPSVLIERSGIKIGIIGAIGDCYSSISSQHVQNIYFVTGSELTQLVKAESERLRDSGADFIIYSIHDGFGKSSYDGEPPTNGTKLASYYDTVLSDGYVDVVFEGHTHQQYVMYDEFGVYHLQNGGDNNGISYVRAEINTVTGTSNLKEARFISTSEYDYISDDPIVEDLLEKHKDELAAANQILGTNAVSRNGNWMRSLVAELYYKAGCEKWSNEYDIVLGGGFISVRSPNYLAPGEVTYSELQMLFPFDNELVLCSIRGKDLREKFFFTSNNNYFIYFEDYGSQVRSNIDDNAVYYVITDTYSAYYAPNNMTLVAEYGGDIFARDLIADYIKAGGLE